jgi:hypothetical protein
LLKIQEDESIYSLIYRTHIINGVSDFSNIITSKGGWASFPKILQGTLHLYEPVDDLKFLNLLRDIGLAKITNKMFKDPLAYREDLERFFGCYEGDRKIQQKSKQIKYCLKCIQDHIREFGYGIIKITWSENDFCPIHETDLYIPKTSNRRESIEALSDILRGIHSNKYKKPSYISKYFHDFRDHRHKKSIDNLAPCLEEEFKKYISMNWKIFPQGTLDKNYSSKNQIMQPYMMEKIYNWLQGSNYADFQNFWNEHAEVKNVHTGVINRSAIKDNIIKNFKVNCQNCQHLRCFSNLAIIPTRSDERLTKRCELNRRILLDYLKNMGISNYGKRIKIMNKMSTKQKMNALSDFKGKDFNSKYKIALDHSKFAYAEPYIRWPKD